MNIEELAKAISGLKGVTKSTLSNTFVERVPFSPTWHFLRPIDSDTVLFASVQNAVDEMEASALADNVLDFAARRWPEAMGKDFIKLHNFTGGPVWADCLVGMGPAIKKTVVGGGYFLQTRTTSFYPINHTEFSGDETVAEVVARRKFLVANDVTRAILPITFCRYHKATGQRSGKTFGVARLADVVDFVRELPRDGGTVEMENFKRERCLLEGAQGSDTVAFTLGQATRTMTVDEAIDVLEVMSRQGADSAREKM